ncbi:MAG: Maf family protein, partial [Eubacteriales bacterium]|nr:Maf family protein [Eubacteriales bacterium]
MTNELETFPEELILASKSPRRIEILRNHGIKAIVMPTRTIETLPDGIEARDAVMYLALKKGMTCMNDLLAQGSVPSSCLILAADTVVYKGEILGKPKDRDDAIRMLRLIRNTSHFVATGCALLNPNSLEKRVFCDVTEVFTKD